MRALPLFALLTLALAASCAPGGSDGSGGSSELALTPDRASYLPTALVTLNVSGGTTLAQQTYPATLGDAPVQLARVGVSQLGLELPQQAPGEYALQVELDGGRKATVKLRVDAAAPVADPATRITEAVSASRAAMAQTQLSLRATESYSESQLAELSAKGEELAQQVEALLAQASDAERADAALYIAANPGLVGVSSSSGAGPTAALVKAALFEGEPWCVKGVDPQKRMDQVFAHIEGQLTGINPVQTYREVREVGGSRVSALRAAMGNLFAFGRLLNILEEAGKGTACAIERFGTALVEDMDSSSSSQALSVGPRVSAASALSLAGSFTADFVKKQPKRIRVLSSYRSLTASLVPPGSTLSKGLAMLQELLSWGAETFGVSALRIELAPATPRHSETLRVNASYLTPSLNPVVYKAVTWSYAREGGDFIFTFDAPPEENWTVAMNLHYAAPHVAEQDIGFYGFVRDHPPSPPTIYGTWKTTRLWMQCEHNNVTNDYAGPLAESDTWVFNKDGTAQLWTQERAATFGKDSWITGFAYSYVGAATFSLSADGKTLSITRADGSGTTPLTVDILDEHTLSVRYHDYPDSLDDFYLYSFAR
ncbi:hypothetical protein FGE12_29515 [Aggregicoccus sp. 17bor-14]|uniref:hypothetical protein n=1 Tax=Myxococcaceae TaxID=31 RepID=UPI00129C996A|nr:MULTISPECIES: hypothetical protein [Myxococcaceae]MBF5046592.1 hypothetical protein [Simulacricoccus sp. 17bor-14]MRI92303.1 hypothetical protein [Aggregicoccus sp. 17bor-14]